MKKTTRARVAKKPNAVVFEVRKVQDLPNHSFSLASKVATKFSKQTIFQKFVPAFAILSLVLWAAGSTSVFAVTNTTSTATVVVDTINGKSAPFNFQCNTNPLFNPVTITGHGSNTDPVGQNDQYAVQVDWGDNSSPSNGLGTITPNSGKQAFTFTFTSPTHTYTTNGNFTILVKLYHQTPPGKDSQGDQSISVPICVHVPPSTKGSLVVTKHVINDNGGTKTASDFTMNVTGGPSTVTPFSGSETGTILDVTGGSYTVGEVADSGYTQDLSQCGTNGAVTVTIGLATFCTITNNDKAVVPPTTYPLTVSVTGNGSVTSGDTFIGCGSSCSHTYNSGDSVILTASSDPDSTFSGWGGDCTSSGTNSTCTVSMTQIRNVSATFTLIPPPSQHSVTVIIGSGTGTVTSDVGSMNCPGTCSASYNDGDAVVLTASAGAGFTFSGFTGDCSGTSCNLTVDSDKTVTANFSPIIHDLTVSKGGTGTGNVVANSGSVDCGSVCTGSYNEGATVVLTATAASGSSFVGFTGDCDSTTATVCTVSMSAVKNVTATFTLDPVECTENCGGSTPTTTDVSITKTVSNTSPAPLDTIIYTLTVNNAGPNDATGVVASDTLPSTVTFVSASSTVGTYDATTSLWTIGTLANGASAVLEITTTVNASAAGQSIDNTATISTVDSDPTLSNNSAAVSGTVTTPSSGCTSNCGGGSSGGVSYSGGGGGSYVPPVGQILGTSTTVSNVSSIPMPEVLGATTSLPRTGIPGMELVGLLSASALAALVPFRRKRQ